MAEIVVFPRIHLARKALHIEHFQAGWIPARVKKMPQTKGLALTDKLSLYSGSP
jgi:hypothetical protein